MTNFILVPDEVAEARRALREAEERAQARKEALTAAWRAAHPGEPCPDCAGWGAPGGCAVCGLTSMGG
jgi:hypothetical protein